MMQPKNTGSTGGPGEAITFSSPPAGQGHRQPVVTEPRPPPRLTENSGRTAPVHRTRLAASVAAARAAEAAHGVVFLFVPVAMGLGAALFYTTSRNPSVVALVAGFLALSLVVILAGENRSTVARIAGLAAAILAGSLAAALEQQRGGVLLDSDVTTRIAGVVEAREFDAGGRVRYLIRLTDTAEPRLRRPPARIRLVARTPHAPVPVANLITGRARLAAPSGPVLPGGYDFAFGAFVDGIGAHGFFYQAPQAGAPPAGPAGVVTAARLQLRQIRERISARIRQVLPGDPGGIAAALAVSDRRGISAATVEALRATGLAHILAISGLHMALAAGTLFVGLRIGLAAFAGLIEAWPVKKFAAIGALLTATAYLLISGGSVPTQRAWIMLGVMLIAVLADRPALTMRNVALAATAIILISPSAVVGPGFQMSFAATAALIAAYAALSGRKRGREPAADAAPGFFAAPGWLRFAIRGLVGLAITSLVAGLATGLFSAHHFNRVAANGLLANMLAMPLVTLVVMPAGLLAMLMMPFGLDAWPLQLMGAGLRGVVAAAHYVDGLGGDLLVGQIPTRATVVAAAGFILLVLLRSWLRLAGIALIGAGALLALPPLAPPAADILVSEDGRLVAINAPGGLASNAARPAQFVFRQWRTALRGAPHLPPVSLQRDALSGPEQARVLDRLIEAASAEPSRFHCASRGICAGRHKRATIIAIDKPELIGAACDRADLVIVAIPVYMRECRSGATLLTSRSLRRSGSMAIRIAAGGPAAPVIQATERSPTPPAGMTSDRRAAPGRVGARPVFRLRAALAGVVRPWTVQRYYDWRSQSYDLPE